MTRRRRILLVAIGALVVVVFWGVYWHETVDSVLTRVPVLDEAWYLRDARHLAAGDYGSRAFIMSPLYTALVAVLSGGRALADGVLAGRQPWALLVFQALAWVTIGGIIAGVVRGRDAGTPDRPTLAIAALAALLFWFYRPAAIFARTILLEIPLTLAVTAYLALVTRWLARVPMRPVLAAVGTGVVLGLAVLLRAHVIVLLVPGLVVIWRASRSRRAALCAALVLGCLVPLIPAVWHNSRLSGRLTPPVLNGGVNLFLGNGPQARGLFTTPRGLDLEHDPAGREFLAARTGHAVPDAAEADRLWLDQVGRSVAARPGHFVVLWFRRVWLHLQGWEIAQVTPLAAWPREVPVLRALVVPYGLLVALGLVGGWLAWRRTVPVAPDTASDHAVAALWAGALVLLIATQSLVFVVSRYRLVLVPALAVLAGLGARSLAPALAQRRWRVLLGPGTGVVALLVAVWPWGLGDAQQRWRVRSWSNEAQRWERWAPTAPAGREPALARAVALYREAAAAEPRDDGPYAGLGRALAEKGDIDAAVAALAEGVRRVDAPLPLQRQLVELLLAERRLGDAEAQIAVYLRDDPGDADMLHNRVVLMGRTGRWSEAVAAARQFQAEVPDDPRAALDLGVALAGSGQPEAAVDTLREGLRRWPDDPNLRANLERLIRSR